MHISVWLHPIFIQDSNRGKSSDDGTSEITEATTSGSPSSKKLSPIKGGYRHDEDSELSKSPESFVSTSSDGSNDNEGDVHENHRFHKVNLIRRGLRKISNKLHKDKNGHESWPIRLDNQLGAIWDFDLESTYLVLMYFYTPPTPTPLFSSCIFSLFFLVNKFPGYFVPVTQKSKGYQRLGIWKKLSHSVEFV